MDCSFSIGVFAVIFASSLFTYCDISSVVISSSLKVLIPSISFSINTAVWLTELILVRSNHSSNPKESIFSRPQTKKLERFTILPAATAEFIE